MSTRQNNLIFVDTWAWLALSNRKDTHHELAKKEYEELKAAGYGNSQIIIYPALPQRTQSSQRELGVG